MLLMDRQTGALAHHHFTDLLEYLKPGDCLVMNNSRVIPARLMGQAEGRTTPIEVVLLTDHGDGVWECLTRPGKKTREGAKLTFGDGLLTGVVESVNQKDGNRMIRFEYEGVFLELLDRLGTMPLRRTSKKSLMIRNDIKPSIRRRRARLPHRLRAYILRPNCSGRLKKRA